MMRLKVDLRVFILDFSLIHHWVDTSAGGLLVPESIILLVVSASALTWFIRYIHYCNLQFRNHAIFIQTKVLLHQS